MPLFACVLVVTTFAPNSGASESLSASPLAEFLAPRPVVAAAPALEPDADSMLSYTYVEVGVAKNEVDDFDDDVEIFYGRGSLNLLVWFYLFGEYSNQSTDFENTDTDQMTLGAGAHFGVLPNLDLVGEIGFLYNDVSSDLDELDDSDTGYRTFFGARWFALPWTSGGLELNGGLGTLKLDNRLGSDDDPVFWNVGVRAHLLRFLSVGVTYEKIEDDDVILGGVRFSF